MKKRSPFLWLIPLILLLLLIPFVVPSALVYAGAEEAVSLPVFTPVELGNPNPESLFPLPAPRDPNPTPYVPNPEGFVYDGDGIPWEYRDGTIYVKVETREILDTKVFFTWVQIADPSQLRAHVTGETNPVKLAKKLNTVLAINGDWYSVRGGGIIYRNGTLMRSPQRGDRHDTLIIDDQGDFHIIHHATQEDFAPYEGHIMHSFMFGPGLVVDGELMTSNEDIFVKNIYGSGAGMGMHLKCQRQVLCQMGKLQDLIISTEGPTDKRRENGFTGIEIAQLAYDMGAVNAYNLDGGNSTCLALNGIRLNRLGKGSVRDVSDIVYFITAEQASAAAE